MRTAVVLALCSSARMRARRRRPTNACRSHCTMRLRHCPLLPRRASVHSRSQPPKLVFRRRGRGPHRRCMCHELADCARDDRGDVAVADVWYRRCCASSCGSADAGRTRPRAIVGARDLHHRVVQAWVQLARADSDVTAASINAQQAAELEVIAKGRLSAGVGADVDVTVQARRARVRRLRSRAPSVKKTRHRRSCRDCSGGIRCGDCARMDRSSRRRTLTSSQSCAPDSQSIRLACSHDAATGRRPCQRRRDARGALGRDRARRRSAARRPDHGSQNDAMVGVQSTCRCSRMSATSSAWRNSSKRPSAHGSRRRRASSTPSSWPPIARGKRRPTSCKRSSAMSCRRKNARRRCRRRRIAKVRAISHLRCKRSAISRRFARSAMQRVRMQQRRMRICKWRSAMRRSLLALLVVVGCRHARRGRRRRQARGRDGDVSARRRGRDRRYHRGQRRDRASAEARLRCQLAGRRARRASRGRRGRQRAGGRAARDCRGSRVAGGLARSEGGRRVGAGGEDRGRARRRAARSARSNRHRGAQGSRRCTRRLAAANAELDAAKARSGLASSNLARRELRAPRAGVVLHVYKRVGESVDGTSASPIARSPTCASLELHAQVPPTALSPLREGMPATVRVLGLDSSVDASVARVAPAVDSTTLLGLVRIALAKSDGIKVGTVGQRARFRSAKRPGVRVPASALRRSLVGEDELVVCAGERRASPHGESRRAAEAGVEILDGLKAG